MPHLTDRALSAQLSDARDLLGLLADPGDLRTLPPATAERLRAELLGAIESRDPLWLDVAIYDARLGLGMFCICKTLLEPEQWRGGYCSRECWLSDGGAC